MKGVVLCLAAQARGRTSSIGITWELVANTEETPLWPHIPHASRVFCIRVAFYLGV